MHLRGALVSRSRNLPEFVLEGCLYGDCGSIVHPDGGECLSCPLLLVYCPVRVEGSLVVRLSGSMAQCVESPRCPEMFCRTTHARRSRWQQLFPALGSGSARRRLSCPRAT